MPNAQTQRVRDEFPGYFTTSEVAAKLGKSLSTVRRWRREGLLEPSHSVMTGTTRIWLYDEHSVRRARALSKTLKPGRVAKKTRAAI